MSSLRVASAGAAPRLPARPRARLDIWSVATFLVAALVAVPILTVIVIAFAPADDIWGHLVATVLPVYLRNTLILMIGVGIGVLIIGAGTAWLTAMCRFPGRFLLTWSLVLPLAMPAYVIAYVYTDLLEFSGPVQRFLREIFGWQTARDYWFPDIRSMGGAIAMLVLVFYPGLLPLCLPPRPGRVSRTVRSRPRGQPDAWPGCAQNVLGGGAAARPPGHRRRPVACPDGIAQ